MVSFILSIFFPTNARKLVSSDILQYTFTAPDWSVMIQRIRFSHQNELDFPRNRNSIFCSRKIQNVNEQCMYISIWFLFSFRKIRLKITREKRDKSSFIFVFTNMLFYLTKHSILSYILHTFKNITRKILEQRKYSNLVYTNSYTLACIKFVKIYFFLVMKWHQNKKIN